MEIIKQININASFETVWHILFNDFERVGEWTTAVNNSVPNPDATPIDGTDVSPDASANHLLVAPWRTLLTLTNAYKSLYL